MSEDHPDTEVLIGDKEGAKEGDKKRSMERRASCEI